MVSKGGKAGIAIAVLFIVTVAILLGYCWWKRQHSQTDNDDTEKNASTRTLSCCGCWKKRQPSPEVNDTFDSMDNNNVSFENGLQRPRSAVDVHVCHSASCEACNPISDYSDGVTFVKTNAKTEKEKQEKMEKSKTTKKSMRVRFASLFARRKKEEPIRNVTVSYIQNDEMGEPEAVEVQP
jgi:hypothetical protein